MVTWETFYDRFYDWADSTQVSNISKLTTFGPSAEVCEIAQALFDEKVAARLIKKAMAAGVRFTSEEVVELDGCVDETLFSELAVTASTSFTADDLDTISCSLSEDALKTVARKSGLELDEDNFVIPEPNEMDAQVNQMLKNLDVIEENFKTIDCAAERRDEDPSLGKKLFYLLAAMGSRNQKKDKKHNGQCDGDCAYCPPHYGYRYGRWYYGHGHRYGCQRGGNGGASGKCYRD